MSYQNQRLIKRYRSRERAGRKARAAATIPFAGVVSPPAPGYRRRESRPAPEPLTPAERFSRLKAMFEERAPKKKGA